MFLYIRASSNAMEAKSSIAKEKLLSQTEKRGKAFILTKELKERKLKITIMQMIVHATHYV